MTTDTQIRKTTNHAFKLKGSLFTLTILQLTSADHELFASQLNTTVKQSPNFFQHAPVVIDVSELGEDQANLDLYAVIKNLRDHHLIPIGIRGANETLKQIAIVIGVAIMPLGNQQVASTESKTTKRGSKSQASNTATLTQSKLITQPVRSGQQIYAQGADLIILASVSPGAEVLADGHIHVYGPLRGRILAGIMGDVSARIFCQSLEAELVSIAGRYLVRENFDVQNHPNGTQIYLENDQLKIEAL